MARGIRLSRLAWAGLAALAGGLAVTLRFWPGIDAAAWDWQPALAVTQPWRLWTAALVHWSDGHLAADLAGCAAVAAFGLSARCGPRAALAWALAWPLTHGLLLVEPALAHYGGLSGLLHAGVAVAAWQAIHASPRERRIGAAVLLGLAVKVLLEKPWNGPLQHWTGWTVAIAPLAHATGALAGLVTAALVGHERTMPA